MYVTPYLPVPLPLWSRLCQPSHQHARGHLALHLLARGPRGGVPRGSHGQREGGILSLGPVDEGIVDKGLEESEEGLATTAKDT